jgi:hypothetical protein
VEVAGIEMVVAVISAAWWLLERRSAEEHGMRTAADLGSSTGWARTLELARQREEAQRWSMGTGTAELGAVWMLGD